VPQSGDLIRVWYDVAGARPVRRYRKGVSGKVDGANIDFTLPDAVPISGSEEVFVNAVLQLPDLDYTIDGDALTFTTAPVRNS
jgi:hypothetical protein